MRAGLTAPDVAQPHPEDSPPWHGHEQRSENNRNPDDVFHNASIHTSELMSWSGVEFLSLTLPAFRKSFLLTQGFFPENEEISPSPYGFLIGIYKFYENWSTGTFRKKVKEMGCLLHLLVNSRNHIQELKITDRFRQVYLRTYSCHLIHFTQS